MRSFCKPIALCLSALLSLSLLGGCDRNTGEYYTETAHSEKQAILPSESDDSGINGYYTLKGAVLNMVNMGLSEDVFRVGQYSGDLEADLKVIIQEITTAEPIGIYGVSSITVDQTRVLTYRELAVSIQYKRPVIELRSITDVRSDYDLRSRIATMLGDFGESRVFQVTNGLALRDHIQREIYTAWMNCGANAPSLNYVAADFYPEGQDKAILEIRPQYIAENDEQQARIEQILIRAEEVAAQLPAEGSLRERLDAVSLWLYENVDYDYSAQRVVNETVGEQRKGTSYTAYGALIDRQAAQSGFVLAASVLLDRLEIEHEVVTGTVGEDIYSWITLLDERSSLVFDVTALENEREQIIYAADDAAEYFIPW